MRRYGKALVLFLLGYYLYRQVTHGTLLLYIGHRFAWLTWPAAILLLVMGAVQISQPREADHAHGDGHAHRLPRAALLLAALPALLGLLLPPRPLGSPALAGRQMNTYSAGASSAGPTALSEESTILDWVEAYQADPDPAAFAGHIASVTGFVFRADDYEPDILMLARFIVTCCAADAAPVALVVRWAGADALEQDAWLEVTGEFEPGEFLGQMVPILVARRVTPIPPPAQPYLYP